MAAWETAAQIALRNCSKEIGRKVSIYVVLVKGEYLHSSTYFFQQVYASLMMLSASYKEQSSP